jgi:hypothetical protein
VASHPQHTHTHTHRSTDTLFAEMQTCPSCNVNKLLKLEKVGVCMACGHIVTPNRLNPYTTDVLRKLKALFMMCTFLRAGRNPTGQLFDITVLTNAQKSEEDDLERAMVGIHDDVEEEKASREVNRQLYDDIAAIGTVTLNESIAAAQQARGKFLDVIAQSVVGIVHSQGLPPVLLVIATNAEYFGGYIGRRLNEEERALMDDFFFPLMMQVGEVPRELLPTTSDNLITFKGMISALLGPHITIQPTQVEALLRCVMEAFHEGISLAKAQHRPVVHEPAVAPAVAPRDLPEPDVAPMDLEYDFPPAPSSSSSSFIEQQLNDLNAQIAVAQDALLQLFESQQFDTGSFLVEEVPAPVMDVLVEVPVPVPVEEVPAPVEVPVPVPVPVEEVPAPVEVPVPPPRKRNNPVPVPVNRPSTRSSNANPPKRVRRAVDHLQF